MSQVQVRVPEKLLEVLDRWIDEGRFKSRSDAIRVILSQYEERERTRALQNGLFYDRVVRRMYAGCMPRMW